MKKIIAASFITFSTLITIPAHAADNSQPLDQIVAVVNDDVITQSELNQAIAMMKKQIQASKMQMPAEDEIKQEAIQQVINRKLQLQIAEKIKLKVSKKEIEAAIQNIAASNNVTVAQLYSKLASEGIDEKEYENTIHDQMLMQKLQQKELAGRITTTPEEVKAFIEKLKIEMKQNKEFHLEEILVPLPDNPNKKQLAKARERAEAIYTKLISGQIVRQVLLAQKKLRIKPSLDAIDYGMQKLEDIPSAFAEKVPSMSVNSISPPIQTDNGFHILHLIATKAINGGKAPSDEQARQLLLQQKFNKEIKKWLKEIREQAFVDITLKNND